MAAVEFHCGDVVVVADVDFPTEEVVLLYGVAVRGGCGIRALIVKLVEDRTRHGEKQVRIGQLHGLAVALFPRVVGVGRPSDLGEQPPFYVGARLSYFCVGYCGRRQRGDGQRGE